jgi:hypothetical protein
MNEREAQKERWERYREAARRLYPHAKLSPVCHVGEPQDREGAFIEITVWIPVAEIQCGVQSRENPAYICTCERDHRLPHYDQNHGMYFVNA